MSPIVEKTLAVMLHAVGGLESSLENVSTRAESELRDSPTLTPSMYRSSGGGTARPST